MVSKEQAVPYFKVSGVRSLTPFQALIIQAHRHLDNLAERGVDVSSEKQWSSRLEEAEKRARERKAKLSSAKSTKDVVAALGDDLSARMQMYKKQKQEAIEDGSMKVQYNGKG